MDPANPVADTKVCLLHEPIIGVFRLPADTHFASIRGDPSPRETVPLRPRQQVIIVVDTQPASGASDSATSHPLSSHVQSPERQHRAINR
jgi:hypothetical protein